MYIQIKTISKRMLLDVKDSDVNVTFRHHGSDVLSGRNQPLEPYTSCALCLHAEYFALYDFELNNFFSLVWLTVIDCIKAQSE